MQTQHGTICRIGVFYDGSFFAYAQRHYYHERELGWLRCQQLHAFIEAFVEQKEPGFSSYKVVYAAWHQGLFTSAKATPDQLRTDRNHYHDLMHAGVEPRYLPMSDTAGEKGTDVALAVDALQVGLGGKIDLAVLVTGEGDLVPLVRALNKQGVRVLAANFKFDGRDGAKSFINERLLAMVTMPSTSPRSKATKDTRAFETDLSLTNTNEDSVWQCRLKKWNTQLRRLQAFGWTTRSSSMKRTTW